MGKDECYEDLLRLLEELELLVRVWRRRTEHPYTAHLRSEAKEWAYCIFFLSNQIADWAGKNDERIKEILVFLKK